MNLIGEFSAFQCFFKYFSGRTCRVTSPTIDLGLVHPNSFEPIDVPMIQDRQIRHCDCRYAVFYAKTNGVDVKITNIYLTTGEAFFSRMSQCKGLVSNDKYQIYLPRDFFETESECIPNQNIQIALDLG